MSLKRAKKADSIWKNTVFGFVREHEKAESINAPEIIKYLILNYYLLTDIFVQHDARVELIKSNTLAINQTKWTNHGKKAHFSTILGSIGVGLNEERIAEYEWTLQTHHKNRGIIIGFIPEFESSQNVKVYMQNGIRCTPSGMFGIYCTRGVTYAIVDGRIFNQNADAIRCDSLFQIRLNVVNADLSIHSNGVLLYKMDEKVGFDCTTTTTKYRLCVAMTDVGQCVEMANFQIKHRNDTNVCG